MTRRTIATEGEVLGIGYMIEPGALEWAEEDGVGVTWQGDYSKVLGKAVDFAREGNLITADIQINPMFELPEDFDLEKTVASPYVTPFERDPNSPQLVTHGIIRAVALQPLWEETVRKAVEAGDVAILSPLPDDMGHEL